MHPVRPERLTVQRDESFVVFLIGARVNRWWLLPAVWGVARAMGNMLRELAKDPDAGLLAFDSYLGSSRNVMLVQYWRSFDDLHRYAHAKEREHVRGWKSWVREWATGAVGIWHETYVVGPGTYECVYHHMPPTGLGRVGPLVPADGELATAARRLAHRRGEAQPAA